MKNKNNQYLLLLFIPILFFACQKPLEINYPEQEPALVVNCLFAPDSLFVARISHTAKTDDSTNLSVTDANCEIWSNGEKLATLTHTENGFYTNSTLRAEEGKAYTIRVSHTDYQDVSATDTVPEKTLVSEVNFVHFTQYDMLDERYSHDLNIKIKDNPNISNFYQLKAITLQLLIDHQWDGDTTWTPTDTTFQYQDVFFTNSNPLLSDDQTTDAEILPFNDKYFNGEHILLNLQFKIAFGGHNGGEPYISKHDLIVSFKTVSYQHYNYTKQLDKHVDNQYSDIYNGIGDPVQMTTNIKNGYGIFAAYNPQTFILHHENN